MGKNFQHRYKEDPVHEHSEDSLYENEIDDIEREIRRASRSKSKDEAVIQLEDGVNKMAM